MYSNVLYIYSIDENLYEKTCLTEGIIVQLLAAECGHVTPTAICLEYRYDTGTLSVCQTIVTYRKIHAVVEFLYKRRFLSKWHW